MAPCRANYRAAFRDDPCSKPRASDARDPRSRCRQCTHNTSFAEPKPLLSNKTPKNMEVLIFVVCLAKLGVLLSTN